MRKQMIEKYTFYQLFNKYIIEIPIIQRDYAQGRENQNVEYIRNRFVTNLVESLVKKEEISLGFIYGKIEGKDKEREKILHQETVNKLLYTVKQYANQFDIKVNTSLEVENKETTNTTSLRFIPLDGQQRLTTMFLLHWYIYMRSDKNYALWLKNFKYNNRKSSLAFYSELSDQKNIELVRKQIQTDKSVNLKEQLQNYTWYLSKWDNDATVYGSLIMLQRIHEEFVKYPDFDFNEYDFDTDISSFEFLDLDEINQTDELYIKMNERGKQLTDFEHFKAWLQDVFSKKDLSDDDKKFLQTFWEKLDTVWLDFFWNNIDANYSALDDFYFNFLKTMAISFQCATHPDKEMPQYLKDLLQDIRNEQKYDSRRVKYIPLNRFIITKEEEGKEELIFELFSLECLKFIDNSFTSLTKFTIDENLSRRIKDVIKAPFVSHDLLESYLLKDNFTLNLWDHVQYYTLLKGLEYDSLEDWLRISRNLIYNTYIQNPENLYNALHAIEELFNGVKNSSVNLSQLINSDNFSLKFFSDRQLKEEKEKAKLLKQPDEHWTDVIFPLENHIYFYGQIGFILKMANNEIDAVNSYGNILKDLFDLKTDDFLLQRVLLSIGDYLVEIGSNFTFCKTDTDSLRSRNENWRRVFNDDKRYEYLLLLVQKIESKRKEPNKDLTIKLKHIINECNYDNNDWKYYFIKSSLPLKKCPILEIRWNNNDDVRLLQSKTVIGYHLELRTVYLYDKLSQSKIDFSPFEKFEFLWDKTSEAKPGISLIGFKFNNKNYRLDIRYIIKENSQLYNLSFYHNTENREDRNPDTNVLNSLGSDFEYNGQSKQYEKNVTLDNIETEIENICKNLK